MSAVIFIINGLVNRILTVPYNKYLKLEVSFSNCFFCLANNPKYSIYCHTSKNDEQTLINENLHPENSSIN